MVLAQYDRYFQYAARCNVFITFLEMKNNEKCHVYLIYSH